MFARNENKIHSLVNRVNVFSTLVVKLKNNLLGIHVRFFFFDNGNKSHTLIFSYIRINYFYRIILSVRWHSGYPIFSDFAIMSENNLYSFSFSPKAPAASRNNVILDTNFRASSLEPINSSICTPFF